jgi:hypothetical protein
VTDTFDQATLPLPGVRTAQDRFTTFRASSVVALRDDATRLVLRLAEAHRTGNHRAWVRGVDDLVRLAPQLVDVPLLAVPDA